MTAARRAALRALLPTGVDGLLVTDLVNIRYLTGFTGSNAALLVHVDGDAQSRLCTDGRYRAQVAAEVPDLETVIERACALTLAGLAAELGIGALGFESDQVTVDAHAALAEETEGTAALVRAPGLVQQLRMVKDDAELVALRTACAIADAAFAELIDARRARARPHRSRGRAGPGVPHAGARRGGPVLRVDRRGGPALGRAAPQPDRDPAAPGDFVKIDFGALVDGYHSDMTRTVVLGAAADWQRELYALVAAAQAAGRAALIPGADVADVDAAARGVVVDAGRGEEFVHPLGHGVGLQIHEAPLLGATGSGRLAAGMAVTVEPGVYLEGRGGVRIEDTLVVTDGAPEVLTRFPKDLLEI